MSLIARITRNPLLVLATIAIVLAAWWFLRGGVDEGAVAGLVSGNGRIEATEIDVAARMPGRVGDVLVPEGDFVVVWRPFLWLLLIGVVLFVLSLARFRRTIADMA